MQERAVPVPRYKLRWRFDFAGKPSRCGVWNGSGGDKDSAWAVNKEGLVRACIEGEDIYTHELKTLVELDGHNYATCEWIAYSRMPGFYKYAGDVTPRVYIGGLALISRTHRVNVYVDGTYTQQELSDEEKLFKKKEHSI
jgi:hypothetical protein